jgi:hypothetical protein
MKNTNTYKLSLTVANVETGDERGTSPSQKIYLPSDAAVETLWQA